MAVAARSIVTLLALLSACGPRNVSTPPADAAPGSVELNQGPPKDSFTGGSGSGTVMFNGQAQQFAIGGIGVDGAAIAVLRTSGKVYRLDNIADLTGTYRRAPADAVPAGQVGSGLWLRNEHGTLLHLLAPPQGRIPDIGTDGVRIVLGQ
jgi:hypothetical protein